MVEDALVERLVQLLERLERREAMPQQEWFSIKQAGAYCGLSSTHVRRALTSKILPGANVGSNERPTYRISRKDLEAWLEQRKSGPMPPPRRETGPVVRQPLPPSAHFTQSRSER